MSFLHNITLRCVRLGLLLSLSVIPVMPAAARTPVGKKPVIVLSFDDAPASHYTYVAPLLKKRRFGATFYICEYPGFENKEHYMTWEQIREISRQGFEIGNHTRTHKHVNRMREEELKDELRYIEDRCAEYGIPHPHTFAYPGYDYNDMAQRVLAEMGYTSARTGGERDFDPERDTNLMLLPSYTITGSDETTFEHVRQILTSAAPGSTVIFCFHGVPDLAHDWVSTDPQIFFQMMTYLKKNRYTVLSVGDFIKRRQKQPNRLSRR